MLITAHAGGSDDDGYRDACAQVPLDESVCKARHVLEPEGARYGGYIEGEHRWVKHLDWCALTVDRDGRVVGVRYLEPSMSWRAP